MNPNGLTPMDESPRGPSQLLRQEYDQTVVPPGTTPKWLGKQVCIAHDICVPLRNRKAG